MYLPSKSFFTEKLVMDTPRTTLHEGVSLTMTYMRDKYWVPQLRRITKHVRNRCYGCKHAHAVPLRPPPTADLPTDRTEGSFEAVGLHYAGPFHYRASPKQDEKAYLILYACSLTRTLYLELLPDQTAKPLF